MINLKPIIMKKNLLPKCYSTLLLLITIFSFNNSLGQTLISDQQDYPPGSTAILSGTGFLGGEAITMEIIHLSFPFESSTGEGHEPWTIYANSLYPNSLPK